MSHESDSLPLPSPDAPASPEAAGAVPVPTLSAEPPLDPIAPLASAEEVEEAPRRGRPGRLPGGKLSMNPDAVKKREARARRMGRPVPQAPPEEPATPTPSPEEIAQAAATMSAGFLLLSQFVAARRGQHWELSSGEAGALGEAWATALAPWLGGIGKAAPWATAIIVTVGTMAPRILKDADQVSAGEVVAIEPPPAPAPAPDAPAPPVAPLAGGGPILPPKPRRGAS